MRKEEEIERKEKWRQNFSADLVCLPGATFTFDVFVRLSLFLHPASSCCWQMVSPWRKWLIPKIVARRDRVRPGPAAAY